MHLAERRILVTGASGFRGGHVVAHLREPGCRRLALPSRQQCDLMRPVEIRRLLLEERPEVVIHLAARVGGIRANRRHPSSSFYHNLMFGVQLIEQCWLSVVGKFVPVGTICSYSRDTPVPFRESDLWNGYPEETKAPYGLAKKMWLTQMRAYHEEFGFPAVNLMLVNLYGPGDNFDPQASHVIPALIRKFVEARDRGEEAAPLLGDGGRHPRVPVRPRRRPGHHPGRRPAGHPRAGERRLRGGGGDRRSGSAPRRQGGLHRAGPLRPVDARRPTPALPGRLAGAGA